MLEMPADAEMRMSQARAADCHVAKIIRWPSISGGLKFYFVF